MSEDISVALIGYSVFDKHEECYEYNEDACYVAATRELADAFREACCVSPNAARINTVMWDDLLQDFGCSGGEYAMEAAAFARFRTLAGEHQVLFTAEPYDGDDSLMVVSIEHRFLVPQLG